MERRVALRAQFLGVKLIVDVHHHHLGKHIECVGPEACDFTQLGTRDVHTAAPAEMVHPRLRHDAQAEFLHLVRCQHTR